MHVLHICETARGGVGTYIDTLVELEKATIQSRVIIPDMHRDMLALSVDAVTFPYSGRSVAALWRMIRVALRERHAFRPDIIFCHSTFSLLALAVLRPLLPRARFIYCAHGWAGEREMASSRKAAAVRWVEGHMARLAHRIVNVSQSDLNHAQHYGYGGNQILIENAVRPAKPSSLDAPFGDGPALIHLLFVGRHDRQKGLDILLAAFAQVRFSRPDLRLHVIGYSVTDRTPETGPTEGVNFLGWISADSIDGYYRSADLVVMPSRWEGLPLVIPEALRNGTPVLVSDRSNLPTLIQPGETGLVFALSTDALTSTLHWLDKTTLRAMRPACFALFEQRYHADRLGREMRALYRELTAQ